MLPDLLSAVHTQTLRGVTREQSSENATSLWADVVAEDERGRARHRRAPDQASDRPALVAVGPHLSHHLAGLEVKAVLASQRLRERERVGLGEDAVCFQGGLKERLRKLPMEGE